MKDFFDIRRFGNYLLYDLRNARNYFWVSLIVLGLLPIIGFVFAQLLCHLFTGNWGGENLVIANQISMAGIALITLYISFPVKVYGRITEKRFGSDWIMIPASGFEKWLSVIIVTCVALPLCFGVLFLGSDALLSAVIPEYGSSLLNRLSSFNEMITDSTDGILNMNIVPGLYLSWCESILAFTLGALVFKKAKGAKTILAIFAIGTLFSMVVVSLFGTTHVDMETLELIGDGTLGVENVVKWFNLAIGCFYTVILAALAGGIYARIKTIKQ